MRIARLFIAAGALALSGVLFAQPPVQKEVIKEPTDMPAQASADGKPVSPLDFTVKDIDGKDKKLSDYRGKVVMMVNVASLCGFTPQYEALESLHKKYSEQGLVVIGFPANNFGAQEPGSDQEIKQFCSTKYKVTFPMMSKISVKDADKAPLYKFLTEEPAAKEFAGDIGWNFTKFLVDRNGNVIARFASQTRPDDPKVTQEVEKALAAKPAQ